MTDIHIEIRETRRHKYKWRAIDDDRRGRPTIARGRSGTYSMAYRCAEGAIRDIEESRRRDLVGGRYRWKAVI